MVELEQKILGAFTSGSEVVDHLYLTLMGRAHVGWKHMADDH